MMGKNNLLNKLYYIYNLIENIVFNNLFALVIVTLIYNLILIVHFKESLTTDFNQKVKYWMFIVLFYIIFVIIYILKAYKEKLSLLNGLNLNNKETKKKIRNSSIICVTYLAILIANWVGWINSNNYNYFNNSLSDFNFYFLSLIILFFIPLILMVLDIFRIMPVDECLIYISNLLINTFNYSTKTNPEKPESGNNYYFFSQKDSASCFWIERVGRIGPFIKGRFDRLGFSNSRFSRLSLMNKLFKIRFNPIFTVLLIVIFAYYFWFGAHNNIIVKSYTWWGIFGMYLIILLINYKKNHEKVLFELEKSVNIDLKDLKNKIFDKFVRRSAYIFGYSYLMYWHYAVSYYERDNYNTNFFESFILSMTQGDLFIILTFLLYFIAWAVIAYPIICDGFGIVPILSNLSKDIRIKMKQNSKELNLLHPDKSAGFKPLGDFCLDLSLLIALPFIIGIPFQLFRNFVSPSKPEIVNYIIDNEFIMAFIGVGIAGIAIFIFGVMDIKQMIEEAKKEKLKSLMEKYKEKLESNPPSPEIHIIDSEIKKIESIVSPPYGKTNVIKFYASLLIPTLILGSVINFVETSIM